MITLSKIYYEFQHWVAIENLFQMILRVHPRYNHHYRQEAAHQQLLDRHHLHQNPMNSSHHLTLQQGHHTKMVFRNSVNKRKKFQDKQLRKAKYN